jgi:hypothetical protein
VAWEAGKALLVWAVVVEGVGGVEGGEGEVEVTSLVVGTHSWPCSCQGWAPTARCKRGTCCRRRASGGHQGRYGDARQHSDG